jgi:hypothetical protein
MSRLDDIYDQMDAHADALVKHSKKLRPLIDEARAISSSGGGGGDVTIIVRTADELAAALLAGGAIIAQAGTYVGNFVIGKPTALTLTGATLQPLDAIEPVLTVRANDVLVTGGVILNGAPDRDTVIVGDFFATDAAAQPRNVTFDDVTVQAGAQGGHRGFALHGAVITVRDCTVTGFWEVGRDSQAIWIQNGPGPYTIVENYLEASGENIMVGGDTIHIPDCVPADILIDGNTCAKPEAWKTQTPKPTVKNNIELKIGRRVTITNNVCDGNWDAGQDGTPIVLTVRNQTGDTPWAIVDDVVLEGNITRRCPTGYAVSVLGMDDTYPSQQTRTLTIDHNLFTDSPNGIRIGNGVADDLRIFNNTLPAVTNNFLQFYDSRKSVVRSPFTFRDNVTKQGAYGISGDGTSPGTPTLEKFCVATDFNGNYLERHPERQIPLPGENSWFDVLPIDPTTFKVTDGSGKGY